MCNCWIWTCVIVYKCSGVTSPPLSLVSWLADCWLANWFVFFWLADCVNGCQLQCQTVSWAFPLHPCCFILCWLVSFFLFPYFPSPSPSQFSFPPSFLFFAVSPPPSPKPFLSSYTLIQRPTLLPPFSFSFSPPPLSFSPPLSIIASEVGRVSNHVGGVSGLAWHAVYQHGKDDSDS